MEPWLVTWEGIRRRGTARFSIKTVVAILDPRYSDSYVRRLTSNLYKLSIYTADEMLRNCTKPHQFEGLNSGSGRYYFGSDPCLYARKVKDLEIVQTEKPAVEIVRWIERAIYGNAPIGSGVVQLEPERAMETERKANECLLDIWPAI